MLTNRSELSFLVHLAAVTVTVTVTMSSVLTRCVSLGLNILYFVFSFSHPPATAAIDSTTLLRSRPLTSPGDSQSP